MNYHEELLGRIAGAISGEVRCDRKTRRRILKDLKMACIEAADGDDCDLGFFYEVYRVLATKSRGWGLVRSSGFRARVNQIVRQYGISSVMFALMGLRAFLETRRQRPTVGLLAPADTTAEISEGLD